MGWADEDPCPLGCGHPFHGLKCESGWVWTPQGMLCKGGPCDCPGPWANERTTP